MTIPFLGGAGGQPYSFIARSLMFNHGGNQLIYKGSAQIVTGNQKTFTISFWMKRSGPGHNSDSHTIFGVVGTSDTQYTDIRLSNGNVYFYRYDTSVLYYFSSLKKLNDFSAWYHVVVKVDTTQADPNQRCRIYVNGVDHTNPAAPMPQNMNTWIGLTGYQHQIGALLLSGGHTFFFDGLLADFVWVDGQALSPSTFALTDPITNEWVPKNSPTAGLALGTNGLWLSFNNITNTTTLGQDDGVGARGAAAGSNDWILYNIPATASSLDVPVNSSSAGNYARWNDLDHNGSAPVVTGGTWFGVNAAAVHRGVRATFGSVEPFYFEISCSGSDASMVSIIGATSDTDAWIDGNYLGSKAKSVGWGYAVGLGNWYTTGVTNTGNAGACPGLSDGARGFAIDPVAGKAWVRGTSGTWLGGGDPDAGTLPAFTWTPDGKPWFPAASISSGASFYAGLSTGSAPAGVPPALTHAKPTKFKRLCWNELSAQSIILSGTFNGASGPYPIVHMGGVPETLTINGNAVTWGTHAVRLATGFRLLTGSASYNAAGSNTWVATGVIPTKHANGQLT